MAIEDGIGKVEHPSYGQLQINRVSSNRRVPLYGTSNECRETVQITIKTSAHMRDLSRDWHFPQDDLITIELSPAQFAEAITSLNMGSGTPCTIRRIKDVGRIEDPPYESNSDIFDKEFKEKIKEAMARMDELVEEAKELQDKKSITKKDAAKLLNQLQGIRQEILSNMPFVASSFSEHMGNVVSSAKIEFEAFAEGKIHSSGLEHLRDQAPKNPLLGA